MRLRESLLFLGVLVALLCIPAAIAAMGGGGLGEPYYIKVVLDEPKEHLKLNIETIDILDPLDIENTSITLQSTEEGDLKIIECPSLGPITREFSPASGHYHGAHVTVVENKTIDGETIPRYQHIYVTKTIPSFTMKIPGREGNALLIKCPEDTGASFIEIFNDADMEVYLFTKNAILYIKGMEATAYGGIKSTDYDTSDLGYTLGQNKVDLDNFSAGASRAREMMGTFPETRPETGTYILAAVEYDGSRNTMHILAAMPVIILDGDTPVTWSGDAPHSWDKGATIFFDGNIDVDKIAYALVKEDTTYSLQVKISTAELANQPLPASGTDVISVLRSIAREGALEEYTLTCDANTSKVIYDSGLAIVEGYGCSGAKSGSSIEIASETLATLSTGTYYLYALGMKGQSVTAVNQTEVTIVAPPPQYGNLTINSVPEGASIWLDGEETGKVTNTTLTEVEVGKHNVTLKLEGYKDSTKQVTIEANETAILDFVLAEIVEPPQYGNLTVNSVPEGASIWLDGEDTSEVTNTTLTEVEVGKHNVTLKLEGYKDSTKQVTIEANETAILDFVLAEIVEPPQYGNLTVNSVPEGASIWLDGEETGKVTNTTLTEVEVGKHNVTLKLEGYKDSTKQVTIEANETAILDFVLAEIVEPPQYGNLTVNSVPEGASIWLDGENTSEVTNTTLTEVEVGVHFVKLKLEGYKDSTKQVTIEANETAILDFVLAEIVEPPQYGNLTINSVPEGASIWLDGEETGKVTNTTLTEVEVGKHNVTLKLEGYKDSTKQVTIEANETAILDFVLAEIVEPPQYGNLTVNSVPEGASIWLDGEDTSEVTNTTLTEVEVGKHNVTLKLEGYKDSTKQVTIEANETAILDFVLAEIVEPPQYGNLTVNSVPEGASIWLDGEETGKVTNTTLTEVEVGKHNVTLKLEGYKDSTKQVTIEANETAILDFVLAEIVEPPQYGNLTVNSVPEGASIWLDGEDTSEVTNTTLTEVKVGVHFVKLKLEGYKDSTKQVTIEANETAILDFVLAEIVEPPQYGNLTINSVPEGASIWLDGEDTSEVTNTTLTEVKVGVHFVKLKLEGYKDSTKQVTIEANETAILDFVLAEIVEPPQYGNLTINSVPEGASIWLDGEETGKVTNTTLTEVEVGKHNVTLKLEGYKDSTKQVTIEANETAILDFVLAEIVEPPQYGNLTVNSVPEGASIWLDGENTSEVTNTTLTEVKVGVHFVKLKLEGYKDSTKQVTIEANETAILDFVLAEIVEPPQYGNLTVNSVPEGASIWLDGEETSEVTNTTLTEVEVGKHNVTLKLEGYKDSTKQVTIEANETAILDFVLAEIVEPPQYGNLTVNSVPEGASIWLDGENTSEVTNTTLTEVEVGKHNVTLKLEGYKDSTKQVTIEANETAILDFVLAEIVEPPQYGNLTVNSVPEGASIWLDGEETGKVTNTTLTEVEVGKHNVTLKLEGYKDSTKQVTIEANETAILDFVLAEIVEPPQYGNLTVNSVPEGASIWLDGEETGKVTNTTLTEVEVGKHNVTLKLEGYKDSTKQVTIEANETAILDFVLAEIVEPPQYGNLTVNSVPEGASIWLDGENTSEVTNTTLTEVEVGVHFVKLKLEGYKDSTKQVTIEANETAILDFVLAEIVEPPQYGNLTINSVPEGASIWLDGEETGKVTNTTLTEVEVGKHNVTLKLEGYKDSTKQVTIEANETAILDFVLAEIVEPPQYGNLTVNSVPEGASIWLDGEDTSEVTNTTLTEVKVGVHFVKLKLEGYKDSTKQVTIEANETAILDFVLAEIVEPPQYGNLTVNSVPEGASIWLDGEDTSEVTNTTLTEVKVGVHFVKLKLEGYKDSTKQVTIEANETAILDFVLAEIVEPPQYGNLTINSVPEGASIWLDGEETGKVTNTTLTEVEVGKHNVTLKLEGYKDSTKQVTIEANETAILDFVLAEIVEPPQYGNLTVNSVPEGASIWLDGENTSEVTNTTLTEVKVGVHFVKLKLEGYKDSTKQVTIEANETAILDFVLAEIVEPPQYGNLTINSVPEGASIWLDGEETSEVTNTTLTEVEVGKHNVTLKLEGYKDSTKQVTIEANETAILDFVLAEIVEPPQYGNLTVNSVPEGASIWLDGENTSEVTNTTLTEVEVGVHFVKLKLEGYKDSTKQVTIEANETAILDFVLAEIVEPPQYGNLTINSVPEGASIWLDGEETGKVTNTTLTEVEVGKHNVTLKLEGYKDSTKQVTIEANETAILDFVLAEIVEPPQYGNLTVNSVPEGASIWLDGENTSEVTNTTLTEVEVGVHFVKLKLEGYKDSTKQVTIEANETAILDFVLAEIVEPPQYGNLTVNSVPEGASIWLDGEDTSEVTNTTLTEVKVGVHFVKLKLEGYKDSTKQVTIEANETAILDFVLAEIVEPPQYGNLTVNSVPEGASIWLDGEETGKVTNTTLTEVEVGKHNVTLKLEGYKDSTKQVTIEANETAILDFVLAEIVEPPQYGNLTVNSVPEGASIWLDGEDTSEVTNTTLTEVKVGVHFVKLKLEGYKDSTKQVTIEANETAILDFVLAEIVEPPQYGNLTVNSVPEGASIWLDGEDTSEVTNTTLTEVEVGKHNVTLKLEGYKDSTKQVTIEANETAILDFVLAEIVEPPQYGNLTVNSVPEGASIWLDGENTSEVTNTTLTEVEVGVHFVKLKLEGYKDSTKQVTIEANETAILDFVLAEIVEPPQYGNLTVNSVPEGASIWLDGEETGKVTNTTLTEVEVGKHNVTLKLEGYKDSTKQVTIEANETAILDFVLAEIVEPPQYGNLTVNSVPEGASIWLDGENTSEVTNTTLTEVEVGVHFVKLKLEGYKDSTKQVTIEANETAILDFVLAEIVEPPQYGNLTVNSVPEGASIWLDGEETGKVTNTTLTEVEVGKHNVTLKLEGYKDSTKQVTIEANETAILDFVLAEIVEPPQYGNLTVNSVPEGASIWLDGEDTSEVTNTTLTEVKVGVHFVKLKLEGYKDSTKQVTIEANETAILDFVLAEIVEPPQYGNLTVNSVPEGASIWLDGEDTSEVTNTTLTEVEVGKHNVTLKLEGYKDSTKQVTIEANETAILDFVLAEIVEPPQYGNLTVNSVPEGASIWLDGEDTSEVTNTTLTEVEVGKHNVTLKLEGYKDSTKQVTIEANETAILDFVLAEIVEPPQYGNLTVNSVPEGASIWLDGEETGKVTNTTLTEVEVGKHNVTLKLEGYKDSTKQVTIEANETAILDFVLAEIVEPPQYGNLTVNSVPEGASIWLDGENTSEVTNTTLTEVEVGVHFVKLKLEGYKDSTKQVTIEANETAILDFVLAEIVEPPQYGNLTVNSVPEGASIWLDGEDTSEVTNTTLTEVEVGKHNVTLKLEGYKDSTKQVTIEANETAILDFVLAEIVEPPQYGNLTVNSVPEGASIWLDGEDTSEVTNTTLTEVEVGKHNVTLKLEGYKDSTKQVTIEANETAILDFVLAEIVEPPQYGNLTVNSVPEGASIWLDGEDTSEVTNTTLTEVEVGEHNVTLKLEGYKDSTKQVTIEANETAILDFVLAEIVEPPQYGNLTVNSVPEGASIWLDGEETGKVTNTTLTEVEVGKHNVTLKLEGYKDSTKQVTIEANETAILDFVLAEIVEPPQYGNLTVNSVPEGASIWLDGEDTSEVTNTTLTEVKVGVHFVKLKLEGYKDSTKQVTIEANETAILDFVLAEIVEPPQYGNLTVNSVPEGASIWLDGEDTSEVTNTTLTEVEVGKHNVTLKLEGYKDSTKQVTIEANETAILDFVLAEIVEPPQYGNLTVNSVPEGASIWLDGEETGKVTNTTLTEVEVGKHNVTLKLEGYKDSTKQVTIEANETAILDFVLAEIVEPPQYGNLTVNSVPEGASIWLDGEDTSEVTNTTLTEVKVGVHFVKLKLEGYKDSTKQVTIEANETAILDFVLAEIVEPPQYGNLTVNSVPEGASIWLDGEDTSEVTNTTLTEVEVGKHNVTLKLEGYKDSTKQVTIEANETAILDFVLAEIVEPPQYGNLTVNSVPEGASIWLDGENTSEVTNTTLTEVEVGKHNVTLKLEGYKDSTKQVTIEANETAILDFVLAEIVEPPQYGNLTVNSVPEGASIWLDGENTSEVTNTTLTEVEVGVHFVKLKLEGYKDSTKQVTIEANETAILDFVLAEIVEPPQYGNLTINSVPEGASIWLDGEETGKVTNTTLTEVEVGKHNVTLKLEGYKDSTKQVTIEANETAILDFVLAEIVEPPQYGNLTVNSVPEGASIWLDGEDTSEVTNTTLTEVKVGVHFVKLKLEGYKDSTKQVTIEANETAILDFVLAEIVEPPQYGNLTVNSVPEGASIWLDGEDTSEVTNTTLTEVEVGKHNVTLKLEGYKDSTKQVTIEANETAILDFVLAEIVEPPQYGNLTVNSVPEGASIWLDGEDTSEVTNTTLTEVEVGEHSVTLTLDDYHNATKPITVVAGETVSLHFDLEKVAVVPVANFTANVTEGVAPLTVQFTDKSLNATTWHWDFGDNRTAIAKNPIITYRKPGNYTVTLNASNAHYYDVETKAEYITVKLPNPVASFAVDKASGDAPLTVQFTDTSNWKPDTYEWNFGDGTTSTEQNPVHTYTTAGTYTVTLKVSRDGGSTSTATKNVAVKPVADFEADTTRGDSPLTVKFTDLSEGAVDEWKWDFGDGRTSTEQDPVHVYNTTGTYTVTLTAKKGALTSTETKEAFITAVNPDASLDAEFRANTTQGYAPLAVKFFDQSQGEVTKWQWNFGDGTTSTEQNPVHTYSKAGNHTVTLKVTGPRGSDTTTKSAYITARDPKPVAVFSADKVRGETPLIVQFTDKSAGAPPLTYTWDFGDGVTSSFQNPTHVFDYDGDGARTYTVKLTVKNGKGVSSIETKIIVVSPPQMESVSDRINADTAKAKEDVPLTYREFELKILKNTSAKKNGEAIDVLSVQVAPELAEPPAGTIKIGEKAFKLGPEGAKFDPPIPITITFTKDEWEQMFGDGRTTKLQRYDGQKWSELTDQVEDPVNYTITGYTSSFGVFAPITTEPTTEPEPTHTPYTPSGGGGSGPTYTSYTGTGTLTVGSSNIALRSIKVNAEDKAGSLFVQIGTKVLDKDGNPLTSITLTPLASDDMPAVPSGALFKFAGYVYEAGPDGATFEPGITLAFDLPADAWNALDPDNNDFKVKWYNEETEEWEDVPTTTYKSTRSVDAEITHFSIFALFTEPVTTPTETPTPPVDIDIPTTPPVDEKPPAGEFPTTIFAIVVVLVIVIAAGYFFIVRK